jgi:RecA/RadA recombinase
MNITPYISTGITALDNLLAGGLPSQEISLIYGEATSGKTTLALSTALQHLKKNPATKATYIDSDNKLKHIRLSQIAESIAPNLLSRLYLHTPQTYSQQTALLQDIPTTLQPGDLTLIDSITGLYRVETGNLEKTFEVNKELNRQLGYIKEMALTSRITFILTGQVRSILDHSGVEPVAPRLLNYWSHTIIKMETTPNPSRRQVTIEKPALSPNSIYLSITERGLEEVKR